MSLVDLLGSTWGVEPVADAHGPGKEVWFELRPRVAGASRPAPGADTCRGAVRPARPTGPSSDRGR